MGLPAPPAYGLTENIRTEAESDLAGAKGEAYIASMDQELPPEEIERRMNAAVRKALTTPPQPRAPRPAKAPAKPEGDGAARPGKRGRAAAGS